MNVTNPLVRWEDTRYVSHYSLIIRERTLLSFEEGNYRIMEIPFPSYLVIISFSFLSLPMHTSGGVITSYFEGGQKQEPLENANALVGLTSFRFAQKRIHFDHRD